MITKRNLKFKNVDAISSKDNVTVYIEGYGRN